MFPPYLSSDDLALRAMVDSDASIAASWFPGPFPIDTEAAGRWLSAQHRMSPWDDPAHLWLLIVRQPAGEIVGSVRVEGPRTRTPSVSVHHAPALVPEEADGIQAGVIGLVIPWLRDELGAMVVTLGIGSDQPQSIAAADGLRMVRAARLREHLLRPGGQVDLLWFQALGAVPQLPVASGPGSDTGGGVP